MQSESALDMLARLGQNLRVRTGVDSVDDVMAGGDGAGLEPGQVYEIAGTVASGKTQLLYSLTAHMLRSSSDSKVCWLDLNGSFRASRMQQFLREQNDTALHRILLSRAYDYASLREILNKLKILIGRGPDPHIRLLLIDNIGSMLQKTAWTLRGNDGKTGEGRVAQDSILWILKELASKITVVVTNHTVIYDGTAQAALGWRWRQGIQRRLVVGRDDASRYISRYQEKKPPIGCGRFKITDQGIEESDGLSLRLF